MGIDLSNYEVKKVIYEEDHRFDDILSKLAEIINDRSIPEEQKQLARIQQKEIINMINISRKPPKIIVKEKASN